MAMSGATVLLGLVSLAWEIRVSKEERQRLFIECHFVLTSGTTWCLVLLMCEDLEFPWHQVLAPLT